MENKQNKNLDRNLPEIEQPKEKIHPTLHLSSLLLGLISGMALIALLGVGIFLSGAITLPEKNKNPDGYTAKISQSLQEVAKTPADLSEEEWTEVSAYLRFKAIKSSFIPSGVPDVYGQELDISFDQVQDAINKVRIFGPTYGREGKKIILTGADLERYKKVGSSIACEYCCGVKTLTKEDGTAACGCAHSQMMRGLAAYLIQNHPEFSNEQILEELYKWKITYFPKQTLSAKLAKLEKAGELGIKELLEEFPDFLPEMVGGC